MRLYSVQVVVFGTSTKSEVQAEVGYWGVGWMTRISRHAVSLGSYG